MFSDLPGSDILVSRSISTKSSISSKLRDTAAGEPLSLLPLLVLLCTLDFFSFLNWPSSATSADVQASDAASSPLLLSTEQWLPLIRCPLAAVSCCAAACNWFCWTPPPRPRARSSSSCTTDRRLAVCAHLICAFCSSWLRQASASFSIFISSSIAAILSAMPLTPL